MDVAGRTAYHTVRAFRDPLQQAISCVAAGVFSISRGGYGLSKPGDPSHLLMLNNGDPVRLRADIHLALRAVIRYRNTGNPRGRGSWRVTVAGYSYWLEGPDHHEVLSYHWHPEGRGEVVPFPHLHLGPGAGVGGGIVHRRVHLPTGHVTLQDVLRLMISEFGVRPRRPDWAEVLHRTQAMYQELQSW